MYEIIVLFIYLVFRYYYIWFRYVYVLNVNDSIIDVYNL